MSDRHRPEPPHPDRAPPVPDDLLAAARAFFPSSVSVERVAGRDDLARVEGPGGAWRLRRWPESATPERLRLVHAALAGARAAGIGEVPAVAALPEPDGGTVLTLAGRRFDAQSWLSGAPVGRRVEPALADAPPVDVPLRVAPPVFDLIAATIARVHAATVDLQRPPGAPVLTLHGVATAVRQAWEAQRERLRPVAPATPAVQRWVRVGERALPAATEAIEREAAWAREASVVGHHRLWPARVLVADGRVTGLVGWEGAAVGSPLLDLAQLIAHCHGWDADAAEHALVAYGAVRPLPPELRRLLPAVVALDLVAETGRLLALAFDPRPPDEPPAPAALRAGAESLLISLEAVAPVVARGDEPEKPPRRRWRRGPRPTNRPAPTGSARPRPGSRPR